MPRTIISIDPDDKRWLDSESRQRHVSMAELVRQAIRAYRVRTDALSKPDLQEALDRTAGLWHAGDGLAYQRRLREEWDRGP